MPRTAENITQADIVDVVMSATKLGKEYGVEIKPDGLINIIKIIGDECVPIQSFVKKSNSVVYFIKCENFVKIGYATDANKRLLSMRTGNPFKLELLKTIDGDFSLEKNLHWRFSEYHHQFEWFKYEGKLKDWLEGDCQ